MALWLGLLFKRNLRHMLLQHIFAACPLLPACPPALLFCTTPASRSFPSEASVKLDRQVQQLEARVKASARR